MTKNMDSRLYHLGSETYNCRTLSKSLELSGLSLLHFLMGMIIKSQCHTSIYCIIKSIVLTRCLWLMPIILATWEAGIRGIVV
jgi:hypothetical protein